MDADGRRWKMDMIKGKSLAVRHRYLPIRVGMLRTGLLLGILGAAFLAGSARAADDLRLNCRMVTGTLDCRMNAGRLSETERPATTKEQEKRISPSVSARRTAGESSKARPTRNQDKRRRMAAFRK